MSVSRTVLSVWHLLAQHSGGLASQLTHTETHSYATGLSRNALPLTVLRWCCLSLA